MMARIMTAVALIAALGACGKVEPTDSIPNTTVDTSAIDAMANDTPAPTNASDAMITPVTPVDPAQWVGRWTGVEGMYLDIQPDSARGNGAFTLEMQYSLDDSGTFPGDAVGNGIRFTRPDGTFLLTATDGEATGLRYLLEKQDCLTVTTGEGYCRD
jgi:hypothetical protein